MIRPVPCKECSGMVRVSQEEIAKILKYVIETTNVKVASDELYLSRLTACGECTNLEFGTTCRYSGYLVQVKAKIEGEHCPNPGQPKW